MYLGTEGVLGDTDMNGLNIVDLATADLTFLGTYKGAGLPTSFNNVRAIEFDVVGQRLIGVNDPGEFIGIDMSRGTATILTNLSSTAGIRGLTFGPEFRPQSPVAEPEPASVWLLGCALVSMAVAAWRRGGLTGRRS